MRILKIFVVVIFSHIYDDGIFRFFRQFYTTYENNFLIKYLHKNDLGEAIAPIE